MKQFILIAISFITLSFMISAQEDNRNEQLRAKLYERLAANSFAIYAEIQYFEIPDKDKKSWLSNGAASAFSYWMSTRKGNIPASATVDLSIAMFYEVAVNIGMETVFSDPLLRSKIDNPEAVGVTGFPKLSQEEYKQYTKEFGNYLKVILEQRKDRQKKAEPRPRD